jgi:hypothetical protein
MENIGKNNIKRENFGRFPYVGGRPMLQANKATG